MSEAMRIDGEIYLLLKFQNQLETLSCKKHLNQIVIFKRTCNFKIDCVQTSNGTGSFHYSSLAHRQYFFYGEQSICVVSEEKSRNFFSFF